MNSAHDEVRKLLDQIRLLTNNPVIIRASDDIEVLTRSYMEPDKALKCDQIVYNWRLTPKEAANFELLFNRMGQVVSRDALYDSAYFSTATGPDPKIIDIFISKMRRKMIANNAHYWLETVPGLGYRLHRGKCPEQILAKTGHHRFSIGLAA